MPLNKASHLIIAVSSLAFCLHPAALSQGQSSNNPGHGGTPPGQSKNKDKDRGNGKDNNEGQEGNGGGSSQASAKGKVTWLTSKSGIAADLLNEGQAVVQFTVSGDLDQVGVWLTPSLSPFVSAEPALFAELLAEAGAPYELTLFVNDGVDLTKTVGGALHLVDMSSGSKGRTYSRPLGINVKPGQSGSDHVSGGAPLVITSSADYLEGPIAPLQIVSIFGLEIGPEQLATMEVNAEGAVADYLAGVQVLFDGVAAPIIAATENQLNVVVPYSVAGKSRVEVIVTFRDKVIAGFFVEVVEAAPAIFTMHGLGHGYAAAYDEDGRIISRPGNLAEPGTVITFFGTGLGLWKHDFQNNVIVSEGDLPEPKKEVRVEIGGLEARILYVGGAPGMVNAVVQFNVEIPEALGPGDHRLIAYSGGRPSKANVVIPVGE